MTPIHNAHIDHPMAWRGGDIKGKDEIAALAGSFERMRTSLVQAMKMLGE